MIDGGGRPAGICIGLLSPHCLLELDMSEVPNSRLLGISGRQLSLSVVPS